MERAHDFFEYKFTLGFVEIVVIETIIVLVSFMFSIFGFAGLLLHNNIKLLATIMAAVALTAGFSGMCLAFVIGYKWMRMKASWELRISDDYLRWLSPWDKGQVCCADIQSVTIVTGEGNSMEIRTEDGKCHVVPSQCAGDVPRLVEAIRRYLPHIALTYNGCANPAESR